MADSRTQPEKLATKIRCAGRSPGRRQRPRRDKDSASRPQASPATTPEHRIARAVDGSAGKEDSTASTDRLMSRAVPSAVIVLWKDSVQCRSTASAGRGSCPLENALHGMARGVDLGIFRRTLSMRQARIFRGRPSHFPTRSRSFHCRSILQTWATERANARGAE